MSDARPTLLALAAAVVFSGASAAAGPLVHDQSDLDLLTKFNVSGIAIASDFVVSTPTRVTGGKVWLADDTVGDNGLLDTFSGELSYAIYSNSGGKPNARVAPAGRARNLALVDTGLQVVIDTSSVDLVAAAFELEHPVSLSPGTYWLVIQEGAWASTSDGSTIWWASATGALGTTAHFATGSPEADDPTDWTALSLDTAFVLFGTTPAWDQGEIGPALGEHWNLTSYLPANDFQLEGAASFSSLEAWLAEDQLTDDDGVLDDFSGVLSWGIFADADGKPGSELTSGTGTVTAVVDAGIQSSSESDVARVRLSLGRSVALAAGTYWLALHEGEWHAPSDGTLTSWFMAADQRLEGIWHEADPVSPGAWEHEYPNEDLAVVLADDPIFALGFEAGVACAWSVQSAGVCP